MDQQRQHMTNYPEVYKAEAYDMRRDNYKYIKKVNWKVQTSKMSRYWIGINEISQKVSRESK